jgi:hypothetical protein
VISYEGYYIKPHPHNPKSVVVVTQGQGGKIPACLDGLFTSVGIAKQAIDQYLPNKPVRKTDGKRNEAVGTSRD